MRNWLSLVINSRFLSKAKARASSFLYKPNLTMVRHAVVAASVKQSISKLWGTAPPQADGRVSANAPTLVSPPSMARSLGARHVAHTILKCRAVSSLKDGSSKIMSKASTILNRRVLTTSDKRALRRQKSRLVGLAAGSARLGKSRAMAASRELKGLVSNDSTRKAFFRVEDHVVAWLEPDTLKARLAEASQILVDAIPDEAMRIVMTDRSVRSLNRAKSRAASLYSAFKLWLQRPVTIGTILSVMAVWTLAVAFTRFQPPWSEIGYASGYGAIFMTAAMTARLTVNSKSLYLEHHRPREAARKAAKEMNSWMIEAAISRRSPVLHEIEEFLGSQRDGRVKELNLKANAFLMRKKDLKSLQDAIYDTFLKGAPPLLFELGRTIGSSVGRDLLRLEDKPQTIFAQISEVSRTLGWGVVSAHGDLARGSRLTFTVRESPFSVGESPFQRNTESCHFLMGVMTGIAEEVYGWPCVTSEEDCVRAGSDFCKFLVTPATVPKNKEKWTLSILFPALFPWTI